MKKSLVLMAIVMAVLVPALAGAFNCSISSDGGKIFITVPIYTVGDPRDGFLIFNGSMGEYMSRSFYYFVKPGGTIALDLSKRCMVSIYQAYYLPEHNGYFVGDRYSFISNDSMSFKAYVKPLSAVEGAEKVSRESFRGFLDTPSIATGKDGILIISPGYGKVDGVLIQAHLNNGDHMDTFIPITNGKLEESLFPWDMAAGVGSVDVGSVLVDHVNNRYAVGITASTTLIR